MSDLRQDFLDGMSCVAATVNVVTTDGPAGRAGVTVSAMASVSADTERPTLLVCVNHQSSGAAPIAKNGAFTVNILRDSQAFVSDTFAGRYGDKGSAKFDCAAWDRGATGAPVLRGALASFDCRLVRDELIGQHHVFFGEVERVHLAKEGRALIYAQRAYCTALSLPPASGQEGTTGDDRLSLACLSSFAPFHIPQLLQRLRRRFPHLGVDVLEGDQAQVAHFVETGQAHIGLLYDQGLPSALAMTKLSEQQPYVLLPAQHPLVRQKHISLRELIAEPLILLNQSLSRDYVAGLFEAEGLTPKVAMRPSSFEMVRSLVANGLGYSILVTRPACDQSYDGKALAWRRIADDARPISIAIVQHPGSPTSEPAEALLAECMAHFRSHESGVC